MRLYTTSVFKSVNSPLRDLERTAPHTMPVLTNLVAEGLRRLRTVAADSRDAHMTRVLWRGMRNVRIGHKFETEGGTVRLAGQAYVTSC